MNKLLLITALLILPITIQAQTGNALSFDNIDDRVEVPNASVNIINSTNMSISMWVYPQNSAPVYPDLDGFAGFRNNNNCDFYIVQISPTGVEARFRNSTGTAYDIVYNGLQLNVWQHFVLTLDGTTLSLYSDGGLVNSITVSGSISTPSESFYLGVLPWSGADFYFDGKLDDVSLWNKSLSMADISCLQTGGADLNDPDLIYFFKCNQGIAGGNNTGINTLTDSKGNANPTLFGFGMIGPSSNFVAGVMTSGSSNITDSICPGDTYLFGSQMLTAPGNYFEVFPLTTGCDSLVELTLLAPTINTSVNQAGPILTSQQAGALYQWIDCLNGDSAIVGATSQTYTASVNGQYAVVVTSGNCSDTSVCVSVTNVGLSEINTVSFTTSPNPFVDELVITFNGGDKIETLFVYTYTGALVQIVPVKNNELIRLNTAQWKKGVYLIKDERRALLKQCIKL